jgi:hypothetical protein
LVNAPYAVFAFHDDILSDSYFEKLIKALEINNNSSIAFSDTLITHVNGIQELWQYTELDSVDDLLARASLILNKKGKWWVPNRGVFRSSYAKKVQGLKIHDSGEFSADLPWLFHLSLYGEVIRIPETLCYKYYKAGSLSRSWDNNSKSNFDVFTSCMRELWMSEIDVKFKIIIATGLLKSLSKIYKLLPNYDIKN